MSLKEVTTVPESPTHRWFYVSLAVGMSAAAYWGFSYTYFIPNLSGTYPPVSPAVHVHGWTFFLWYLLLPFQALLIATGRRRLHISLGGASLALAAVMIFTGILVASVRIEQGLLATDPDEVTVFWKDFGQLIMYNMALFAGFYATAILRRNRPDVHKRMMVLASASALVAALFRIIVGVAGFNWLATPGWVMPTAFMLPVVFVAVGVVYDLVVRGSVHRAYLVGLPILVVVHGFGLATAGTAVGDAASRIMAIFAHVFGGLY